MCEAPLLNIKSLFSEEEGDAELIKQIGEACEKWGFFYIYNHHIDSNLLEKFREKSKQFFSMSKEQKKLVKRSRENSRGYFDDELTKTILDWKEGFDYGAQDGSLDNRGMDGYNQWPEEPLEFEKTMREWFAQMLNLSKILLKAIAKSLDWDPNTFMPYFETNHTSMLRLNHYPVCPNPEQNKGVHHHTDAGVLTVLLQDDHVNSLSVFHNNKWILIPPKKDTFVVNIGDMMQIWTNDRYKAALHRVECNKFYERYSAPFFYNPAYSSDVKPLYLKENEKPLYKTVNWGYFRSQRYAGDYANYGEEIQISQFRDD